MGLILFIFFLESNDMLWLVLELVGLVQIIFVKVAL